MKEVYCLFLQYYLKLCKADNFSLMLVNNKYGAAPNADRVTHDEALLLCWPVRAACPMVGTGATDSCRGGGFGGNHI